MTTERDAAPARQTAKQQFDEMWAEQDYDTPLERLRFFCSLAMTGQDWLDVEPFFDELARSDTVAQRDAVLEEAVKAAVAVGHYMLPDYSGYKHPTEAKLLHTVHDAAAMQCAEAIRALKKAAPQAPNATTIPEAAISLDHGPDGAARCVGVPPQSSYEFMTREQIETFRDQESAGMHPADDFEGPRLKAVNTICDMAVNAILFAQELNRLRDATTPNRSDK